MTRMELKEIIAKIETILNTEWISEQEQDLCTGCKYFEPSWELLVKALPYLKEEYNRLC